MRVARARNNVKLSRRNQKIGIYEMMQRSLALANGFVPAPSKSLFPRRRARAQERKDDFVLPQRRAFDPCANKTADVR
jgi:hypothetical protein